MFILDLIDRELHSLKRLELKFGLSSEFFDKIPVRILLDVLFRVFRFSKASFYALMSVFLNGPGRTVTCSLYIYTSQYLKEHFTVRCIIFSLRTDIGKQTISFFATNNNYPIFHFKYKR